MKKLIVGCLLSLALVTPSFAEKYTGPFNLEYLATFTPPHNEAIVGGLVERYRFELTPSIDWKGFELSFMLRAQGANKWRRSSEVGNGFGDWGNSDWGVDEWRYSYTAIGIYRFIPQFGLYIRQYSPINKNDWKHHGNESHYDVQVGITGRLF